MKKKLSIAAAIMLVIAACVGYAGYYLMDFAIVRKPPDAEHNVAPSYNISKEDVAAIERNSKAMAVKTKAWLESAAKEEAAQITSDGLKLKAQLVLQPNSHKWLIAVHGYTRDHHYMEDIAYEYAQRKYQVLLPDLRAHGLSEGTHIGMGWLDRKDLLQWIDYVVARDPDAEIILHGISMGAATVMMTAGEKLPVNVKCVIEDCGYTSAWDILSDELDYLFKMPEFPLLYAADFMIAWKAGYKLKEASAVQAVARTDKPMMFVHGTNDTFVKPESAKLLYAACKTRKELLYIEGAPHAKAYQRNPRLYFSKIFSFIDSI